MRCPRCKDEYEPHVATCVTCHVPLLADGAPLPVRADARLGSFHPTVAARVAELLERRHIAHQLVTRDDDVEVLVDEDWRDDLRAELVLTWTDLVHRLPEDDAREVLALGGSAPGWYDSPRGGWVDREGRLVVDVEGDDADTEAGGRLVGPTMATIGAVLLLLGWYVDAGPVPVLVGLGLVLVGLFVPR